MMQAKHKLRIAALAVCAALALLSDAATPAAAWEPNDKVQIIIHASPKGSISIFLREVEKYFSEALPKGVGAQHLLGAGGDRARRYVLGQKGNPLVIGSLTPSNVNNPILHGADYGVEDFTPLAVMVVSPFLVTVNAKSPYKTLDDLIQAAKKNPGKIVQGGGDVGETDSLHHVLLSEKAGVKMAFTPFESKGIVELLGGHVDFVIANPAQVNPYVKSGDFRVIASSVKLEGYPDVPTLKEAGYDIPILKQYRGMWMPPGVPKEAVQYYIDQLDKYRQTKEFKDYVAKNNLVAEFITGDELGKMLKEEQTNYRRLDKQLGLLKN